MNNQKEKQEKQEQEKEKLDKDVALARIKIRINKYYEDVGREIFDNFDLAKDELIQDIDDILDDTNISQKDLILEKLDMENKEKDEW